MVRRIYFSILVFAVLVMLGMVLLTLQNFFLLTSSANGVDVAVENHHSSRTRTRILGQPIARYNDPKKPVSFFGGKLVRKASKIMKSSWVTKLKKMLSVVREGEHVSVVFVTDSFLESILNWLIAAKVRLRPPLTNIIIFCLDREIFNILDHRGIPSIYIDPNEVVDVEKFHARRACIWLIRMVVYRLVTNFGHDVMGYDSDAIVLRNPQTLLEEHPDSDVISSAGMYPHTLGRIWRFTACMGVILFRSTPKTSKVSVTDSPMHQLL